MEINGQQKVTIKIGKGGKVQCTVDGVAGTACTEITKFLKELGTPDVKLTDDYYLPENENQNKISLE